MRWSLIRYEILDLRFEMVSLFYILFSLFYFLLSWFLTLDSCFNELSTLHSRPTNLILSAPAISSHLQMPLSRE